MTIDSGKGISSDYSDGSKVSMANSELSLILLKNDKVLVILVVNNEYMWSTYDIADDWWQLISFYLKISVVRY